MTLQIHLSGQLRRHCRNTRAGSYVNYQKGSNSCLAFLRQVTGNGQNLEFSVAGIPYPAALSSHADLPPEGDG
jgi:hypothetical protein